MVIRISIECKTKLVEKQAPPSTAAAAAETSSSSSTAPAPARSRTPSAAGKGAAAPAAQPDAAAAGRTLSVAFNGLDGAEQSSGPLVGSRVEDPER